MPFPPALESSAQALRAGEHGEEAYWLADALQGRARAVLWHAPRGLVAPRSYRRHPRLDQACAASAAAGWPVTLRGSGGGVVPQGTGVLNLSISMPVPADAGVFADALYRQFCDLLLRALGSLGLDAASRAVPGSFCDGRYNLAVGERKVAGTAQQWRRSGGSHAVLVHALILVHGDTHEMTAAANDFEAALESGRRYDAAMVTTLAEAWRAAHGGSDWPADLALRLRDAIGDALATA